MENDREAIITGASPDLPPSHSVSRPLLLHPPLHQLTISRSRSTLTVLPGQTPTLVLVVQPPPPPPVLMRGHPCHQHLHRTHLAVGQKQTVGDSAMPRWPRRHPHPFHPNYPLHNNSRVLTLMRTMQQLVELSHHLVVEEGPPVKLALLLVIGTRNRQERLLVPAAVAIRSAAVVSVVIVAVPVEEEGEGERKGSLDGARNYHQTLVVPRGRRTLRLNTSRPPRGRVGVVGGAVGVSWPLVSPSLSLLPPRPAVQLPQTPSFHPNHLLFPLTLPLLGELLLYFACSQLEIIHAFLVSECKW